MRERKVKSAIQLLVGDNHLTCSKCGQVKELNEENFYRTNSSPIGFKTTCKICKKKYYEENKDKRRIYQREYWGKNREYYLNYSKLYREDKNKAKEFTIAMFKKQKYMEKTL